MPLVYGPSLDDLDRRGDEFSDVMVQEITRVVNEVAATTTDLLDLGMINTKWEQAARDILLPYVERAWTDSGDAIYDQLTATARQVDEARPQRLIAALRRIQPSHPMVLTAAISIPKLLNVLSVQFMANALNRLVGVGNLIWNTARDQMVLALQEGESIAEIRDRIVQTTGLVSKRATVIARTEVIGASNAGSVAQMRTTRLDATKEWLSTEDQRTRPTHRVADGAVVDINEKFMIGGYPLDHPHDQNGPPGETINCRCTLIWDIPEDEFLEIPEDEGPVLASGEVSKFEGAMVALVPSVEDVSRLELSGFEPADELHLTLVFLGDNTEITDDHRESISSALTELASSGGLSQVPARAFGAANWNPEGTYPCWVLNVGDDKPDAESLGLAEVRDKVLGALTAVGFEVPGQHSPWQPHVCLAYTQENVLNEVVSRIGSIQFDRLRIAFSRNVTDIPL